MNVPFWAQMLAQFAVAMLGTVCFALIFEVPARHFAACGLTGAVGWLVYCLATLCLGLSAPMATLLATLPLTAAARLFSLRHKAPVTLFLLSGIFPLVPGAGIYYTAYYLLQGNRVQCMNKGVETLKIALALALGIALVGGLPLPGQHGRKK